MRSFLAPVAMLVASCGVGQQPYPSGGFIYEDQLCDAPSPDGGVHCVEVGNGESYARCTMDAQCPAQAPFCRLLGLYGGGDFNCNFSVRICRATTRDDCRR